MAYQVHDVVVIGAGMAGLSAAHELVKAGHTDVVVLEAQDYVGGRVKTTMEYGDPAELGAEFVHGKNIVTWQYLDEFGLSAIPTGGNARLIDRSGNELSAEEHEQFTRLYEEVQTNGKYGVSIAEITESLRGDASKRVVDLVNTSIGDYEASDAELLDSGAFTVASTLTQHNGGNYVMRYGYRQLVDKLSAKLRIHLSTVVQEIDMTNPHHIKVVTDEDGILYCRRVVVTVSLGVLKHGDIRFLPELPERKRHVIQRLGMGNAAKYLLHFRTGKTLERLFRVAGGENESLQTIGCWWQSASNHKLLVGYTCGSRHDAVVGMDEPTLHQRVLSDLHNIVGHDVDDNVTSTQLVRWDTNPFVRGAYSNHPVGVSNDERAILAETIGDRLFFAGEATVSSGNYATVHGAIESGQRVAAEISHLKNQGDDTL